ncbi:hypothetical protein [Stenotrophomonas forensis]|uniref:hypothetical protein n=1 Tax=Stenotrophomonas forensis TaxID=2871169 RepID=UPI0039C5C817
MDDVIVELSKPAWWVSVVVFGVLVNIASSYLKKTLDGSFSRTSAWWRDRSIKRKIAWQQRVLEIKLSDKVRLTVERQEMRCRLQAIQLAVMSAIMMLMPIYVGSLGSPFGKVVEVAALGFALLIFLASFYAFRDAANCAALLRDAAQD